MEKILFSCTNSPLVLVSPLFKKLRKEGWTLIREERLPEIMAWYGGGGVRKRLVNKLWYISDFKMIGMLLYGRVEENLTNISIKEICCVSESVILKGT